MSNLEELLKQGDRVNAPAQLGDRLRQAVEGELAATAGMAASMKLLLWLVGLSTVGAMSMVAVHLWTPATDGTPAVDGSDNAVVADDDDARRNRERANAGTGAAELAATGAADTSSGATDTASEENEVASELPSGTPAIQGVVSDEAGRPIAGAPVRVRLGSGAELASMEAVTDESGAYRVKLGSLFQRAIEQRQSGGNQGGGNVFMGAESLVPGLSQNVSEKYAAEVAAKQGELDRRKKEMAAAEKQYRRMAKKEKKQIAERTRWGDAVGQERRELAEVEQELGGTWTTISTTDPLLERLQAAVELGKKGVVEVDAGSLRSDGRAIEEEYERLAQLQEVQARLSMKLTEANERMAIAKKEYARSAEQADRARAEAARDRELQIEAEAKKRAGLEVEAMALFEETRGMRSQLEPGFTFTVTVLTPGYQPAVESFPLEGNELVTLDLVLAEAERVHGVVLDATGQPVAGAVVSVIAGQTAVNNETRTTTTDEHGSFDLASLPEGQYLVRARADGLEPDERAVHTGPHPTTFQLRAAALLAVEVRHSLPGAIVRLQLFRDGQYVQQFWTNEEGVGEIGALKPGRYELHAFPPEGAQPLAHRDVVLAAGDNWLTLDIPDPVSIEGEIVTDDDINLAEVIVVAYFLDAIGTQTRTTTRYADAEGKFEIQGLPRGEYVLGIATRLAHGWGLRQFVDVHASAPRNAITIPFEPVELGRLVVRARDADGNPIPGAALTMNRESTGAGASRTMGKDGDDSIELHPDRFHLVVDAQGFVRTELTRDMAPGEEVVVEVTLAREPDLAAVLLRTFAETAPVSIYEPLSLGAYLTLVDSLEPGAVAVADDFAASGYLDIPQRVGTSGAVSPAQHLAGIILEQRLGWHMDGDQLVLEMPPQK